MEVLQAQDLLVLRFPTTGPRARLGPVLMAGFVALMATLIPVACFAPRAPYVALALLAGAPSIAAGWRWRQVALSRTVLTASDRECAIVAEGVRRTFRWEEVLAVHDRPFVPSTGEHEAEVQAHLRLVLRPQIFGLGGDTFILAEGHDDATRAFLFHVLEAGRTGATTRGKMTP